MINEAFYIFILNLWNPVYTLHLQHISIHMLILSEIFNLYLDFKKFIVEKVDSQSSSFPNIYRHYVVTELGISF